MAKSPPKPRIAFLITVHNSPTMASAMEVIRFLYSPHHFYVVHVDSKIRQASYDKLVMLSKKFKNIKISQNRIDVRWGTLSIFDSELQLIQDAFELEKTQNVTFDFATLICGQTLPLHTEPVLTHIFSQIPKGSNILFGGGWRTKICRDLPPNICERSAAKCGDDE